jgi:hypothetical protein
MMLRELLRIQYLYSTTNSPDRSALSRQLALRFRWREEGGRKLIRHPTQLERRDWGTRLSFGLTHALERLEHAPGRMALWN